MPPKNVDHSHNFQKERVTDFFVKSCQICQILKLIMIYLRVLFEVY